MVTTPVPSAAPDSIPLADESLVRRFQSGQPEAATALYARYATRLRAIARAGMSPALAARLESDDIVQLVFRRFFRAAGEGRYRLPSGLPQQHWDVVSQRLDGFEVAEIAARLGRSKRTVERILQEARIRLQLYLGVSDDDGRPRSAPI